MKTSEEVWAVVDNKGHVVFTRGGSSTIRRLMIYTTEKKAYASLKSPWIPQTVDNDNARVVRLFPEKKALDESMSEDHVLDDIPYESCCADQSCPKCIPPKPELSFSSKDPMIYLLEHLDKKVECYRENLQGEIKELTERVNALSMLYSSSKDKL